MPLVCENNFYEGYIKANGRRYFVKIFMEDPPNWDVSELAIDGRLSLLLQDSIDEFIEANSKDITFIEFFSKLEKFVQSSLSDDRDMWLCNPMKAFKLCNSLGKDVEEVGHLIKNVDTDEGLIHIESVDVASREHKAVLNYTDNYPNDPIKIVRHDLPLTDENIFHSSEVCTISEFCQKFVQLIDTFQEFWNNVSILDSKCWILDPENPTFKDRARRIRISNRISVVLVLNPWKSKQRPDITFVGCSSTVSEFREILQKNLENELWDPNHDILRNLMNVLEVKFPTKPEMNKEDHSINLIEAGECVICFTLKLNGELPNVICDNSNCLSHYHSECLSRYLRSIPKNSYLFGRIQGDCPNCNEIIFCPIKD